MKNSQTITKVWDVILCIPGRYPVHTGTLSRAQIGHKLACRADSIFLIM